MKVACPSCGADVEFRFDDSLVRICASCNAAVARTDRGVESLGKVADLVPAADPKDSPLALFADGTFEGATFILIGFAQIAHAKGGRWQEWYGKFGNQRWGWLAEAQGALTMTFAVDIAADLLPAYADATPGSAVELAGKRFVVSERSEATYASARGEIPYRLVPGGTFRFADLAGEGDTFATIDYGADGAGEGDRPVAYVGRRVTVAELGLVGGEATPQGATTKPARGAALVCPKCGGKLELRVPDRTLRVTCPYCDSILDVGEGGGKLAVIGALTEKPVLDLPLGSHVALEGHAQTVIGFVQRSAFIDDTWYRFFEYLLWAPGLGYRWLVSSDGHWSYVQPVSAADPADPRKCGRIHRR